MITGHRITRFTVSEEIRSGSRASKILFKQPIDINEQFFEAALQQWCPALSFNKHLTLSVRKGPLQQGELSWPNYDYRPVPEELLRFELSVVVLADSF